MAHFLRILTQLIIAAGLAGSLLFYVTAYLSSRAFMRRQRRQRISRGGEGEWLPGMTVLKPLKGLDVDLFENLATFCRRTTRSIR